MAIEFEHLWSGNTGAVSNAKITDLQIPSTLEWNAKIFDTHQKFWDDTRLNICLYMTGIPILTGSGFDIPPFMVMADGIRISSSAWESIVINFGSLVSGEKYLVYVGADSSLGYAEVSTLTSQDYAPLFVFNIDDTTLLYPKILIKDVAIINGHIIDGTGGSGTLYTAGDGIDISNNEISSLYDNSTIKINQSNQLYADIEDYTAGGAIDIANKEISVLYDNSTLKLNQANELYADVATAVYDAVVDILANTGITIDGGGDS